MTCSTANVAQAAASAAFPALVFGRGGCSKANSNWAAWRANDSKASEDGEPAAYSVNSPLEYAGSSYTQTLQLLVESSYFRL